MYNIKIYDNTGILKGTVNNINELSFSGEKNKGLGSVSIELDLSFGDLTYTQGDIVEIVMYNDDNKDGVNIFAGELQEPNRFSDKSKEGISIEALGLYSMLSNIKYYDGVDYAFSKTDTAKNILLDIVSAYNTTSTRSPPVSYNGFIGSTLLKSDIPTDGPTISVSFSYKNCLNAIQQVIEQTDWSFYIDSEGTLIAKEKSTTPDHYITYKKNINSIDVSGDRVLNRLWVRYGGTLGTSKEYSDSTSIATYGRCDGPFFDKEDEIDDETTADEFASNWLDENKDPKRDISVVVNNKYNFFNIKPGDTVKIMELDYSINNVLVEAVNYGPYEMKLSLEKYQTLASLINS